MTNEQELEELIKNVEEESWAERNGGLVVLGMVNVALWFRRRYFTGPEYS